MDQQPLTPEQQKKVKKAKITLWLGIAVIVVIGLLIIVYFVFLKESSVENTNTANTNTTVDTSNWDTYINAQYGFQFKYPGNWSMKENTDGNIVSLSYQNNYYIYITNQGKNPDKLTVNEWLTQVKGQAEDFGYELKYDEATGITLAGLDPAVYQGVITLYFMNNNDVFGIEWFDNEKKNEEIFKIFNAILLSFEFN